MPQHHVDEAKKDDDINVPLAAAHGLRGIASLLDGSNKAHSMNQHGPGTHSFTVPAGHVGRVFVTTE